MSERPTYQQFLEAKRAHAPSFGIGLVGSESVNGMLKPHQRDIAVWAARGGRRAIFANFGLGKTFIQLEAMRLVVEDGGIGEQLKGRIPRGLIVAPLGVRQEFMRDAEKLGIELSFIRSNDDLKRVGGFWSGGLYLTNYESVREGKIDPHHFCAVSLDEAAVLRGFGGTKTFREFMRMFAETLFRFVATATPSPNQYIEILAYAAFLGIMDVGEAKTRFFKRNPEKADQLTLHPHKEEEFWLWVHSWAVFLQRPSELGYSDEGYDLPPFTVRWHSVPSEPVDVVPPGRDAQPVLLRDHQESGVGVQQAAAEKRASLDSRLAKVRDLVEASPDEHVIIWHDLEDERRAIENAVPGVVSVYGSQDLDERENAVMAFADGQIARLAAKPVMLGSGCNLQRHCARAIFAGVGFKFNDFVQAIHRIYRFLQTRDVVIDIVHAESEAGVVKRLQEKWARHDEMMAHMSEIVKKYGLHGLSGINPLERTIGVERRVDSGSGWMAVNNDAVEELRGRVDDFIGLIVTSIPFGTQYEYTPSYNDFGHTDDDTHFWAQMDYLTPELLRVLKPGRVVCVHVKDRIRPGGMDGLGFQTASPFHAEAILHYRRHGFAYLGMITVVTDVVRENNQTYRLGWTEQCKDGSRMGVGMPEYVLLFRKPPTDASDGYADERVVKSKDAYTRARWQIDAHAFWRSSGNRLLSADDLVGLPADEVFRVFRGHSFSTIYDHEEIVALGQSLENAKRLPPGFMLLQPQSAHPDVWTDVARMRTMNTAQSAKGREQHLCPMPLDIVKRLILRYSNEGDVVLDPFAGLFTVPLVAVENGRRGHGIELNPRYFDDGVRYLRTAKTRGGTLFDFLEAEEASEEFAIDAFPSTRSPQEEPPPPDDGEDWGSAANDWEGEEVAS